LNGRGKTIEQCCSDAAWQKAESGYAGRNLCSRSSNGSERPFPKLNQGLFLNFCFHCFSWILIDFKGDSQASSLKGFVSPLAVIGPDLL
jgi:hypothetical protein